jgi:hypothetical protein
VDNQGTITEGYQEFETLDRPMPSSRVYRIYEALATEIRHPSSVLSTTLSHTENPLNGGVNTDGLYLVDRKRKNLTIRNCQIRGTLVVRCKKLILQDAVTIVPYRPDFPALIVKGNVEMKANATGRIRGLVHVMGSLTMKNSLPIEGSVLCDGKITFKGETTIVYLPGTYTSPPIGYTSTFDRIIPDRWTRLVD